VINSEYFLCCLYGRQDQLLVDAQHFGESYLFHKLQTSTRKREREKQVRLGHSIAVFPVQITPGSSAPGTTPQGIRGCSVFVSGAIRVAADDVSAE
jgi:hypothetical protein